MKLLKTLCFGLAVSFGSGAMAQDCSSYNLDQQSMNACAKQDWEAADRLLNAAYKQAKVRARQNDEYLEAGETPAAKLLLEAQRAWIPFRDQACELESTLMRGGSAQPLLYWGCMARLTEQRTYDLNLFASVN